MIARSFLLVFCVGAAIGCSDSLSPNSIPSVPPPPTPVASLSRNFKPVVLTGDSAAVLIGIAPSRLVGFRYDSGAWTQIPIQIDERAVVTIGNGTPSARRAGRRRSQGGDRRARLVGPQLRLSLSTRWILDQLHITADGASGVDILDRHKSYFAPGSCTRSEYTASRREGAFVVNRAGPIRIIRSYVGFNSGPLVQRQHIFYDRHADVTVFLRVHPIPGILDVFDYSAAAVGMTYRNNQNPQGVLIDGRPDAVRAGALEWETVQGAAGTMVSAFTVATSAPALTVSSFYDDAVTSQYTQCTGDESSYGSSGNWITSDIPNTDPRLPDAATLSLRRQMVFGALDLSLERMGAVVSSLRAPLTMRATSVTHN